ncbi:MAG TPA: glycosyltransferase [Solirubrobacterales bacterium]|nr:glycosyltransferase [Solirubrobacterales bacterium]
MKVAMVSEHASPLATLGGVDAGGQNVFVDALSRELARRGGEVVVYTRRDDTTLPRRVELCPGVEVEHVPAGPAVELPKDDLFPHMPQFAAGLARSWRRERPDLVHAHFWMSGHASLLAAESMRLPVVQTFHALGTVKRRYQGGMDTSPPQRLEIERQIVARVDRLLATCSDEVFELMRMGAENDRTAVVPCGVDLDVFGTDGPAEQRDPDRRRLLYLGRLVRRKGVGNVIEALPRMPGVEFVIAGGPPREALDRDPEARRLAELAERHGVVDRVQMRGRVPRERLPELIRSADAVVSVPWYEPFGIVPLEAMACGVPVIASAVGGMIDSVVDGQTGIHVPPRDPERLAEAALDLLADRERCRAYGRAGAKRARRLYDWRRVGSQVLQAYEQVLAGRVSGRRRANKQPAGSEAHLAALGSGIAALEAERPRLDAWGEWLGERLLSGARLLAAGNGGSAAEAQHLTAELVGRFQGERRPLSAIALHADTSSLTAIGNDYGIEEVFARQVEAHGRAGDVLVAFSTSGRSENLLRAVEAANRLGLVTWAMTGPRPNPLAEACDEAMALDVGSSATVQELQLVALHLVCAAVDRSVGQLDGVDSGAPAAAPVRQLPSVRQAVR